jgi:hypothetical protein
VERPPKEGFYWPTLVLALAAAGAVAAIVAKQWANRPAPEKDEAPVTLSTAEHALAAPSPSTLGHGSPVGAAADPQGSPGIPPPPAQGQIEATPPGEQAQQPPDGSMGFVRGDSGMSVAGKGPMESMFDDPSGQEKPAVAPQPDQAPAKKAKRKRSAP